VHGELESMRALATRLGDTNVHMPGRHEEFKEV
jgi:hypothetical protein